MKHIAGHEVTDEELAALATMREEIHRIRVEVRRTLRETLAASRATGLAVRHAQKLARNRTHADHTTGG